MVYFGKKLLEKDIAEINDELVSINQNKANKWEKFTLRPSDANSTQTIITANSVISIIKGFDKSKFGGKSLDNLKIVRYYRYNTLFNAKYQINFSWYRLNSAANPGASSTDYIYCIFTFTGNYDSVSGTAEYESWINDTARNQVIFEFVEPNT